MSVKQWPQFQTTWIYTFTVFLHHSRELEIETGCSGWCFSHVPAWVQKVFSISCEVFKCTSHISVNLLCILTFYICIQWKCLHQEPIDNYFFFCLLKASILYVRRHLLVYLSKTKVCTNTIMLKFRFLRCCLLKCSSFLKYPFAVFARAQKH